VVLYFSAQRKLKSDSKEENDWIYFKEHIQIEGYLHTLIGFFAAILTLVEIPGVNETPELSSIAFPIGTALLTSIAGWFLGNELTKYRIENEDKLSKAVDKLTENIDILANSMSNLTDEVLLTKVKYEKITREYVGIMTNLFTVQKNVIDSYNNSLNEIRGVNEKANKEIQNSLREISQNLNYIFVVTKEKLQVFIKNTDEEFGSELKKTNDLLTTFHSEINTYNRKIIETAQFNENTSAETKRQLVKLNEVLSNSMSAFEIKMSSLLLSIDVKIQELIDKSKKL